jgi:hypothetical protein
MQLFKPGFIPTSLYQLMRKGKIFKLHLKILEEPNWNFSQNFSPHHLAIQHFANIPK